jgi:hypothetical protein
MESLSSNLHNFLNNVSNNLSLPDKKFLRDALIGLIRAGKPIVCKMARQLPDQHTRFLSRLDRLEQHLISDNSFDEAIKGTIPDVWLPFIEDNTPIILDLSDLAKPLAKRWTENGSGLGIYRWVVERTHSWLHQNRRLRIRYEKRDDVHQAFLTIGCIKICWNHLLNYSLC